jgi:hypothetical protein
MIDRPIGRVRFALDSLWLALESLWVGLLLFAAE